MNHDVYEKEMIDGVNRHANGTINPSNNVTPKAKVVTKTDKKALKMGLKRMAVALLTALTFGASFAGFVGVVTLPGYLAVVLFIFSVMLMAIAVTLLYAQGINPKKSGESAGSTND